VSGIAAWRERIGVRSSCFGDEGCDPIKRLLHSTTASVFLETNEADFQDFEESREEAGAHS